MGKTFEGVLRWYGEEMGLSQKQTEFEVETEGLTKVFAHKYALNEVSLKLAKGDFLTIVGPNGAGKTTLIRCLAGLARPSSGRVLIGGQDARKVGGELRRRLGLVSHHTFLYDDLTAEENLRFYGRMYDVGRLEQRMREVIEYVGLEHRLHDPVRTFSRGMGQRLAIARVLMHEPAVVLLDEPYTGLDEQATSMLRQLLRDMAEGQQTVILTTHNLGRALDVGDRLAILVRGRIANESPRASLDLDGLRATYRRCAGGVN